MNHETQVELLERALALVEGGSTDMVDEDRWQPVVDYCDPERLEAERALLKSAPIIVADASALKESQSYITHDDSGVPIVVMRGADGVLRALLNVCRHRGARLVEPQRGRLKVLQCPYHAWTYANDGRLLSIPDQEGFPSACNLDLISLPVIERFGFIWVRPEPNDASLEAFFAPLSELESFSLGTHASLFPYERQIAADWKIVLELGLEAYHVRKTHAQTIYKRIFFGNRSLVDHLDPHIRIVFPTTNIKELRTLPKEKWNIRNYAYVGYLLFPNTTILIEPDHAMRMTVFPTKAQMSTARITTLTPEYPADERAWSNARHNKDLLDLTLSEDFAMGESIAKGLSATRNGQHLFGRFEQGLQFFHASIDRALCERGYPSGSP